MKLMLQISHQVSNLLLVRTACSFQVDLKHKLHFAYIVEPLGMSDNFTTACQKTLTPWWMTLSGRASVKLLWASTWCTAACRV